MGEYAGNYNPVVAVVTEVPLSLAASLLGDTVGWWLMVSAGAVFE
jgi:hypothetical protein